MPISNVKIQSSTIAYTHHAPFENRPTIVFLHDSLGCIATWKDFPETLSNACNCNYLVYDREGYGASSNFSTDARTDMYLENEADLLSLLLDRLDIKDAILFGHSDGGSIALIAAAKYKRKISAVITEGAHIFVEPITLKGIESAVEAYSKGDLKAKLAKYHGDKVPALFDAWAKTWLSPEFKDWNITSFLPFIQCPVLVIQGKKDEFGTVKQMDEIEAHATGSVTKLWIPEVGHTPHKEATQLTLLASFQHISMLD